MGTGSTEQLMVKHTAALLSGIENKEREDSSQHKEYTLVILQLFRRFSRRQKEWIRRVRIF